MDIKNIGEFASYCQDHAEDETLPETIEFADRWTSISRMMEGQYGGHGQEKEEWIEQAYQSMVANGSAITQEKLLQTHEILTKFWEHGKAFDRWFKSKVIIVQGQPVQTASE